jgi:hypothetical protein
MMGASRDGHTFILVGPDGKIRWRADYGGPPKYVMFLPTASLLTDIKEGEHPSCHRSKTNRVCGVSRCSIRFVIFHGLSPGGAGVQGRDAPGRAPDDLRRPPQRPLP